MIRCKGVRIGGFSGIYKPYHYGLGHYEVSPYTEDTKRSAYHVRKYEMDKLAALVSDGSTYSVALVVGLG